MSLVAYHNLPIVKYRGKSGKTISVYFHQIESTRYGDKARLQLISKDDTFLGDPANILSPIPNATPKPEVIASPKVAPAPSPTASQHCLICNVNFKPDPHSHPGLLNICTECYVDVPF